MHCGSVSHWASHTHMVAVGLREWPMLHGHHEGELSLGLVFGADRGVFFVHSNVAV